MRATIGLKRRGVLVAAFVVAAFALALTAALVQRAHPSAARAADHLDAPSLMPPGGSVQTDITDLYAFRSPANPASDACSVTERQARAGDTGSDRSVRGRGIPASSSGTSAVCSYNLNVDNNGDAVTDVNLACLASTGRRRTGRSQIEGALRSAQAATRSRRS